MKALIPITLLLLFLGCDSNRSIKHFEHPITNESITLLVLGGISKDYTYIIQGEYNTKKVPKRNMFAVFNDSFGISYNDSSWVVFHLGDIVDEFKKDQMNFEFIKLDNKFKYRHLVDSTETEFIYRYYF